MADPTLIETVATPIGVQNASKLFLEVNILSGNYACVSWQASSSLSGHSVSDNAVIPNTWVEIISVLSSQFCYAWHAFNCNPATVITIDFNGTTSIISAIYAQYNNVGSALDGTPVSNTPASTAIAAGNITTTQASSLLIQHTYQQVTSGGDYTTTDYAAGSGFTLGLTDKCDGTASQFKVQTTAGTVNPTITQGPASSNVTMAWAVKSAAAGTPIPTDRGWTIRKLFVSRDSSTPTSSFTMQFPCSAGSLITLNPHGSNTSTGETTKDHSVTGISDPDGNTYNKRGADNTTSPRFDVAGYDILSVTASAGYIKPTLTFANGMEEITCVIEEHIPPAGTTSSFDVVDHNHGTQNSDTGTLSAGSLSPSGSGIVVGMLQLDVGAIVGTSSPDPTAFDAPFTPEMSGGFSRLYEDGGHSTYYHTGTGTLSYTWLLTGTAGAGVGNYAYVLAHYQFTPPATWEQEGYRFRNDDGSETTASWKASQDTDVTSPSAANTRLRVLVDTATADPQSTVYQLEFKKSTDTLYRKIEAAGAGTLATGTTGAVSAGGTTSVAVAYPTTVNKGDLLILVVGNRPNANTPADITGWDKFTSTGGAGSEGAGTGTVRVTVYIKKNADGRYEADGTEAGNVTVNCTSGTSMFGRMVKYVKTTGKQWNVAVVFGADSSAGTSWSATAASNPGLSAGDFLLCASINSEDTARAASEAVTATGCTFGTMTEKQDSGITTGNDLGMIIADFPVSTGPSSAAPVFTMTMSGTNSANSAGPTAFIRIRQQDQAIQLSASANITAGGENTTAQLTPPASGSFTAGRIQDDVNPSTSVDIANDGYSEFEWCLIATATVSDGDVYQFRVTRNGTPFDTYTVTPQWTIGTPIPTGGPWPFHMDSELSGGMAALGL